MRGLEKSDRVALLISECQRGVIERDKSAFSGLVDQVEERQVVAKSAGLAEAFRRMALPVFHLHVAHTPGYPDVPRTSLIMARSVKMGGMQQGSEDVDAVPGLLPEPEDVVHSRSFSLVAFHGTDLDTQLRNRGITTVVLAGVSSNIAIPGMALCASDLGYQVVVAEDCVAGASAETHEFSVTHTLPLYSTLLAAGQITSALEAR